jgi:16S rRNA (uracil1498-N3)-methyltransferase
VTTRLYVDPARLASGTLAVDGNDFRYLCRVLRLRPGDALTVFDGQGRDSDARVLRVEEHTVWLEMATPRAAPPAGVGITLCVALLKGERMDLVVQKATELGASRIVPMVTARSVVKLAGDRAQARTARWQKIAREASRQSGRSDAPEIAPVTSFDLALASISTAAFRVLFYEGARQRSLRAHLPSHGPPEVAVVVGPEGGFTEAEIQAAESAGFVSTGLGPRVLRAETAALAALAVLGFALGDLG